jgi:arylsulfatase A-like enzyme
MQKSNIIFILIDDMGWRDLGCYGSGFYDTPHLDRLAAESVRFTDAYAACPVCSPTRASIMSGKYPATVGITNYINAHTDKGVLIDAPYLRYLPLEEQSLALALQEGGYQTWHVGKWHLGDESAYYPLRRGFDVNIGGCSWGAPRKGYFSPYGIETLSDGPEGEHLTDRLTDEAISLIQNADRGKPFFLNLWHYSVHTPIQAPNRKLVAKYEQKAKDMGLDKVEVIQVGEPFPTERLRHGRVKRRLVQSDPDYAAMVEHLDGNIGRLFEALEQSGQADNTWVIFTSDNGGLSTTGRSPTSNAPLNEGKGWMYEGGVREPLLIKGPGVAHPGSLCQEPVSSPDFYPTLLEMAGLPLRPNQHIDGVSLMPLLLGEPLKGRDALFWHFPHYANQGGTPGCSIRMGDYKLIEFFEDNRLELYNLREDLGESNNLAQVEPDRARAMHDRLVRWRESVEAKIPERNPDYMQESN